VLSSVESIAVRSLEGAVTRFILVSAFLLCAAFPGLGLTFTHAQKPGEELRPELEAVRKERAELEAKVAALKQRELVLQRAAEARKNGYYARVEVKGRLGKEVYPMRGLFGVDAVIWTLTAGENRYELFFDNSPSKDTFVQIAEKQVGESVLVSGELAAPRHPRPQLLEVKSFTVPEK
jgi:hypothetical protein